MWIPKPIYERAPQYWIIVGLLLVILGIYLGLQISPAFLFIGCSAGLGSIVWGSIVLRRRKSQETPVRQES